MEPEFTEREQADLAAYADGSLPRARRRELEARLAASPALREALERQRTALASVRAAEEEPAPQRLRAWLRDQDARRLAPRERVAGAPGRPPSEGAFAAVLRRRRPLRALFGRGEAGAARRPLRAVLATAAVAAVVAVTLVLVSSGGTDPSDLAEAATRPPERPAPAQADELHLAVAGDGIAFPDWEPHLGWRAIGSRTDEVGDRRAVTVTYERGGRTVSYAILARPALDLPDGRSPYRSLTLEGRPAVAWIRDGRTCLLLGDDDVAPATLRRLAASVRFY